MSATFTQQHRDIEITTPLGKDALLLRRMRGREELGRLSHYELELLAPQDDLDFDALLGKAVSIRVDIDADHHRYFHGHVTEFSLSDVEGRLAVYHAVVRPALWFLTLRTDCRIFNDKSVPAILDEVLGFYTGLEVSSHLDAGAYAAREYTVQYRESDFDFISRLMEREGIYYFFTHEKDKHVLHLADAHGAHQAIDGPALPYRPIDGGYAREVPHVSAWRVTRSVRTGKVSLSDFDFKKCINSLNGHLKVETALPGSYSHSDLESYDYPGAYIDPGLGTTRSRVRVEAMQASHATVQLLSNARRLAVGALFTLADHPRADQNRSYLVVSANYDIRDIDFESKGVASSAPTFSVIADVMADDKPFRPLAATQAAIVRGPQTAMVVGKAGEEIDPDQYGRVKVQFHWDRLGKHDEHTTCWIRVAQLWAGQRWGAMFIPRIGQEVIVDFLEGDPDTPIIVGRVYNSDSMPPYTLPANKTLSTIMSNSTKGGGGFNELRFDDKKGEEQVFLHAQKDEDVRVLHDAREWIGNDRSLMVGNDQKEKVAGKKSLTVSGDHLEKVAGNHSLQITGNEVVKIDGNADLAVTGNQREKITGNVSLDTSGKLQQKVAQSHAVDAGMQIHLKAGMDVVIEAGMSITLKAGGGFIVVGPAGVTISGTPILLNSGGSAGSGNGCSPESPGTPTAPADPAEADKGGLR